MDKDNPGGGDPVKPYTDPAPGTPSWHNAKWWEQHKESTREIGVADVEAASMNWINPAIVAEQAENKRAALLAASNIWAGNGGYAAEAMIKQTAAWMLDWLEADG